MVAKSKYVVIHECYKCGKKIEYTSNTPYPTSEYDVDSNLEDIISFNSMHKIELGRMGYGSRMDGSDVNFTVCDNCLVEWISTFPQDSQDAIHNSGCNYVAPDEVPYDEDWDSK